jgi:multiple sugar transport system substrate-binding protein
MTGAPILNTIGTPRVVPVPRLTRGGLLRTVLPLPAAFAVAACGAGQQAATLAKPPAPIEIEYWSTLAETHVDGKGRLEALKLSQAANQDYVRIRFEQPGGSNMEKLITASASGTPPNLVVYPSYDAAAILDAGMGVDHAVELKPLPQWQKLRSAVPASYIEGASWLGKQVAIPLYTVNQGMVYAPDLLEKAGIRPPTSTWTWNDFLDIAKRASRPPDIWGLDRAWNVNHWVLWAGTNGATILNKERTKITLTQPESIATVEFLNTLTHGNGLVPPDDLGELLQKGQTVFQANGPYRIPQYRTAGIRFEPILPARGPQKPTAFNRGTLYSAVVLKSSDPAKQRAAVIAAVGALSDDAQLALCKTNLGLPASKSALDSTAFQQFLAADRQMKVFADMFASCWVSPPVPSFSQIETIGTAMMTKVYKRQDSIRNALAEAERQAQLVLDADLAKAKK